jgi:signal transduction histidine kinase/phage shock protein PspC (stress-responsive transcriptional regulator)
MGVGQPGAVIPRQAPPRPPFVRPRDGRVVGGVAAGLSAHLGLPVTLVRIALAVSTVMGGFGGLLYLWLWAFAPVAETVPPQGGIPGGPPLSGPPPYGGAGSCAPWTVRLGRLVTMISRGRDITGPGAATAGTAGAASAGPAVAGSAGGATATTAGWAWSAGRNGADGGSRASDLLIGAVLLVAGLAMLATRLGYDVQLRVVVPLVVVVGGALLAYNQLDEVERHRRATRTGVAGTRAALLRMVGGLALVLTGTLTFLLQSSDVVTAARALVAGLAVLAGTALVLAPWGVRLWRDLDTERAARIREAERADLAAHLHDSVLQTLALIQRQSGDQAAVTRLARSQERDLRDWLYGPRPVDGGTLATEVRAAAADVEDRHGVAVEVVLVGDRPYDERVAALVAALREAIVNAVRHGGAPVQVYVESGPDAVEAFVRDRGPGFDLALVPADRLGVRESIIARMERHGGSAALRSRSGEGTEVRLVLPVAAQGVGQPVAAQGVGQPVAAQGVGQPVAVTDPSGQQERR